MIIIVFVVVIFIVILPHPHWWNPVPLRNVPMYHLMSWSNQAHDDVIKWKHFPRYWPFVRGIHRSPVNSPHKGQWYGALMFSLICVWIDDWVNNREAGDLRRYRAHYEVTVMVTCGNHAPIGSSFDVQKTHHWDYGLIKRLGIGCLEPLLLSRLCNWLSLRRLVPWINHL